MSSAITSSDEESDEPTEQVPNADPIVLSEFVSNEILLKSFYLHFFIIFLMPILSCVLLMPTLTHENLPTLEAFLSLGLSVINSWLMFNSYEDIYHPFDYEEKRLLYVSDLAQILDGFTVYSFVVVLIDSYFVYHITPVCWQSIKSFHSYILSTGGTSSDNLNADLIYIYLFELVRIVLTLYALNYQRDIRSQMDRRNSYLERKYRELYKNSSN